MTWRGGPNWLSTVPREGRAAIRQIQKSVEMTDVAHRASMHFRWSVLCTPSIGIATDVVLIARSDHDTRRWHVIERGQLIADTTSSGEGGRARQEFPAHGYGTDKRARPQHRMNGKRDSRHPNWFGR